MDRWKNWKRLNPLCLILALALVVCPATRAFAYTYVVNQDVTDTTTATFGTYNYFSIEEGNNSYVNDTLNSSYNYGVISNEVDCTIRVENHYDFSSYPLGVRENFYGAVTMKCLLPYDNFYSGDEMLASRGVSSYFEVVDYFTVPGASVEFKCSNGGKYYTNTYVTQDHSIYFNLYGDNLPEVILIRCRLRIYVTIEPYSYNITDGTDINVAYQWRGLKPYTRKTMADVSHGLDYCQLRAFDLREIDKSDSNIYKAINDTAAGNAIDQANDVFVQDAAQLESHQSVLENAADASVAAVDMDQVNLIDTYSQSVSFWGQLIGQLPTILGSLWYVFIFGLLIAFVLFVLRIRR